MAQKSQRRETVKAKSSTVDKGSKINTDWNAFRQKYTVASIIFFGLTFLLLSISVFKNISYPLFWADESMTAVGAQRVLQFGYPKVHDGKNVLYDLRHSNPKLGIDPESDAYIGGTNWGHYYFAALGVKLTEGIDDLYTKTGFIRSTFAIVGIVGLLIFVFLLSGFFEYTFDKFLFAGLFFLLALFSVSLALLLREVRYYSLTIFLASTISGLYVYSRFRNFSPYVYAIIGAVSLWLLYFTFSPAYFIFILTLAIAELAIAVDLLRKKTAIKDILINGVPFYIPIIVSLIGVAPLLGYFKTFEISKAMEEFNGYNSKMYWSNVGTVFNYFKNFELLWLAIVIKMLLLFQAVKLVKAGNLKFKASLFLTLLFLVYCFAIAKVPNFVYTRYIIAALPLLIAVILLDIFILNEVFAASTTSGVPAKTVLVIAFSVLTTFYIIGKNSKSISGHLAELTQPYKGPLDYTIPYIKDNYKDTDKLVIAANYEETSYMFYLGSKVVLGFIGNNLEEDAKVQPDILAYRKPWGNHIEYFQNYMKQAQYVPVSFPIYDNPVNNIPELNFMPAFNHVFKTKPNGSAQDATELYVKKQ